MVIAVTHVHTDQKNADKVNIDRPGTLDRLVCVEGEIGEALKDC